MLIINPIVTQNRPITRVINRQLIEIQLTATVNHININAKQNNKQITKWGQLTAYR